MVVYQESLTCILFNLQLIKRAEKCIKNPEISIFKTSHYKNILKELNNQN